VEAMDSHAASRRNADEFARYYGRLAKVNMAPLWEVMRNLVTPEPVTPVVPAHWRYCEVRPLLFESADMIYAEQAERRVLVLENPGLPKQSSITHSLYAGIQLVMPGEIAPQHRHTQAALRFILEGNGATTTVDGERFEMYPGDMILTPSWQWHDHQNETQEPIVWMDGLDIALVGLLDASFAQNSNRKEQEVTREKEASQTRYGANLLPIDDTPISLNSPLMRYPYDQARGTLERLKTSSPLDPCHGIRMRYAHPRTGDWAMPTMGPAIQLVPKGFASAPYRATDGTIFAVAEGRGTATIGDKVFTLSPHDVFVCPPWAWRKFKAQDDLVLFHFSDRPVQEKLGLWREERSSPTP
jgi:gentisate 1,2-dioxygenase